MIDEGYVKYEAHWEKAPPIAHPELPALCEWRARLHDAGLIGEYSALEIGFGNLSARVDGRQFLISGTGTGRSRLSTDALFSLVTRADIADNRVECRGPVQASSEALTHAAIYLADPAIRAVVHVHDALLWQAGLKTLPSTAQNVAYGTPAMASELARLTVSAEFRAHGIAAMAGHDEGLIAAGESVAAAAQRILEFQKEVA